MATEDNSLEQEFAKSTYDSSLESEQAENQVESVTATRALIRTDNRLSPFHFNKLAFKVTSISLVLITIIGVGSFLLSTFYSGKGSQQSSIPKPADFAVSNLQTQNANGSNQNLQLGETSQLDVNGQLKVSNTLVLTPSTVPTSPTTGQIYYDSTSNAPYYYNGSQFISLAPSSVQQSVTSIGGVSGSISVGNGLQITSGQLSLNNNALASIGKFKSLQSGTSNLVISNDGNGDYTLSDNAVVSTGSIGQIALFTGSQTISGSILSQSGSSITLSGTLSVNGSSISSGTADQQGSLILNNGLGRTGSLVVASIGQNTTYTLPDAGSVNATICLSIGNCASSNGAAGGDLTGSYPNPTIAKLQGVTLSIAGLASGQVLQYNGANWVNGLLTNNNLQSGNYSNITGTGILGAGSIALGFGAISTGNPISTTAALQGGSLNVDSSAFVVNGSGAITAATGLTSSGTVTFSGLNATGVVHTNNNGQLSTGLVVLGTDTTGSYVNSLGGLTGLTTTGNSGAGSTPTLAVSYGSTSNTSVQGNTNLTCASGTGNLAGGGNSITLGGGGSCNNLTITNSPTFTGTLAVLGSGGLTIGNPGSTIGSLNLANTTNTNMSVIQSAAPSGSGNATYTLPAIAGGNTDTVCLLNLGNCTGTGGGVSTTGGTPNTIAEFTGTEGIGNSSITDNGSNVTIGNGEGFIANAVTASTLQSASTLTITPGGSLTVGATNHQLLLQGNGSSTFAISSSGNTTTVDFVLPTANRSINFPDESGTICLQNSINCGFAASGSGVNSVDGLVGALTLANSTGSSTTITINNAAADGATKGIAAFNSTNFSASSGVINTIQGISTISNVQFGNLTLGAGGNLTLAAGSTVFADNLTNAGASDNITINSGNNNIEFENQAGANTFMLPTSGGTGQVICTSGITCTSGGGQAVILEPTGVQAANSNRTSIYINKASGSGNLIELQAGGSDAFVINSSGNTTINNTATANNLTVNGILTANTISPTAALTVGLTGQSFTLQGNGNSVISATAGGAVTKVSFDIGSGATAPNGNVNYQFENDNTVAAGTYTICSTAGNCAGVGGSITGGGTSDTIAMFTGASNIGNSLLTENTGTNTVTVGSNLAVGVGGASQLSLGVASSANGTLVFNNSTNSNTLTIQEAAAPTSNTTIDLPNQSGTVAVSATGPLSLNTTTGQLSCTTCLTSGGGGGTAGVSSLDALTGALTLNNSSGTGTTITINNASTTTPGIAQFNATDFSVSGGIVDTIQGIATTSSPTFTNLTLQGSAGLTVGTSAVGGNDGQIIFRDGTNDGLTSTLQVSTLSGSNRTVTIPNASGTLAVSASGNLSLSALGNMTITNSPTFTGTLAVQGSGGLTIGNPGSTIGSLNLSTSISNVREVILQGLNPSGSGNATVDIPTIAGGNIDTVCLLNLGNCIGTGGAVSTTGGTQNYITKYNNGGASQITNSELYDNGSFVGLNTVTDNGQLSILSSGVGTDTGLFVQGAASATTPVAVFKGGATPGSGADLLDLENSSGTILAKIDYAGNLTAVNGTFTGTINGATISGGTLSGGTVSGGTLTGIAVDGLGVSGTAVTGSSTLSVSTTGANALTLDTGGASTVNVGNTNANNVQIGRLTTAPTVAIQGNAVTVVSSNNTNSTTLGFTGTQAANNITYTLDRTVAAGSYAICTSIGNCLGGGGGGANTALSNLSSVAINTNLSFATSGGIHELTVATPGVATTGDTLSIVSASGNTTGSGGVLNLLGGTSGSGATGNGGAVNVTGGNAASTNGNGGNLSLDAGAKTGSGTNGTVSLGATNASALILGNASSTFALTSNGGLNVTTSGALSGISTITTSGTINGATISGGTLSGGTVSGGTLTGIAVDGLGVSGTAVTGSSTLSVSTTGANALTLDTGGASTVNVGNTNANNVQIGRLTTAPTVAIQGNAVTVVSSNNTNSTTLGFTGTQAANNITYTLDRTVAAGSYAICTSIGNCLGGGGGGANTALSNLSSVAINTNLSFATSGGIHELTVATPGVATTGDTLSIVSASGNTTGSGGVLNLLGGTSGSGATGNGGAVNVTGGNAASTNGNGGNLSLDAGAKTGSGTNGTVSLGATNASALILGNASSTFALTSNGGLNVTTSGALSGISTITTSGTINGATISGGTLSGGTVSGGTLTGIAVDGLGVSGTAVTGSSTLSVSTTGANALTLDTGGASTVNVGNTNANNVQIGRLTTAPTVAIQGNAVTVVSSNNTNSTTLGFTGTQAANNITYTLDRTVAAGSYAICTSIGNCLGGGGGGANTALSNLSSVAINTNLSFATSGGIHELTVATPGVATTGDTLSIVSASGNTTGSGGVLNLLGGTSGSGATGNGGAVNVTGGNAASTNGNGGNLSLDAGAKTGSGTNGTVSLGATNASALILGNASSTFALTSNGGLNVTTSGALSGISTITTSGTINGATISGGTLSGGTVSGGTLTGIAVDGLGVSGTAVTGSSTLSVSTTGANALTLDTGGASTVNVGNTNANNVQIGRLTTAPTVAIQGNAVTVVSSNNTNSTTLGFTGTQAANNITYTLDRTVAAGSYAICTSIGNCLGGGGGGANTALSNLSSVAINTNLSFATSGGIHELTVATPGVATTGDTLSIVSASGNTTGSGGVLNLLGGTSGSGATGNGGAVNVTGGNAASTNGNGGNLSLDAGAKTGSGTNGTVSLGATNASALILGNASSTFALTSNGGLNVTTSGALSGISTITTSGTINGATISGGTLSGGTVSGGTLTGIAVDGLGVSGTAVTGSSTLSVSTTGANALTLDTGGASTVNVGNTNANNVQIGRLTTAPTVAIQGNAVTVVSSNNTNSTTLGFTGTQAANNITYTLDRTVAAGSYAICTSIGNCLGGGGGGANTALSNLSSVAINTNLSFATSGGIHELTVATPGVATTGDTLSIVSASGNTTGSGGVLNLLGGTSGSGATGNGGAVNVTGGNAASTNGNGGNLSLDAGAKTGSGTNGTVSLGATNASALILGNASSTFALTSNGGLNVTTSGALSGISTITTSGTINGQTISTTANFTGTLAVTSLGSATNASYLCYNSSSQIASCSTTANGAAFIQGGNNFGASTNAILGTNGSDNGTLGLETDGTTRAILDTSGNLTFQQASTISEAQAGSGVGNNLNIKAGQGATSGNQNGGNLVLEAGAGGGSGTSGTVIVQSNTANSTTAFQVQNAAGTQVLGVDTTDSIVNIQGINSAATKGSNLVTGAFNGGNWSSATYWTLTATNATHTSTGNTQALTYSTGAFTPTASTTYEVIFTFINGSNDPGNSVPNNIDGIYATLGGVSGPVDYAFNDTYDALITTTGTGGLSFTPTLNWVGTISNVYVYKYVSSANADLQVIDSSANVGLQVSVQGGSANDIFLGSGGTGDHDTVGTYNTALGAGSLLDNTDGNYDTAVGADSLQNTTGGNNPAGGTFGGYNTALGAYSLFSDTTGNNNTAIGAYTMYDNTTGSTNVAIGVNVLDTNTTGSQNNAIGFNSLQLNTLGSYNVAMGPEAVQDNTSGSWDVGIGNGALQGNTTGGSNVGIGFDSGVSQNSSNANTTGSWDTFIGGFSGPGVNSSQNLQGATAIGADSTVGQNNALTLGCVYGVNNCAATTSVAIGSSVLGSSQELSVAAGTYGTDSPNGTTTTICQGANSSCNSNGNNVYGTGTSFTANMVGGTIYYNDGSSATITGYTSATQITVNGAAKTVTCNGTSCSGGSANTVYNIVWGGFNVSNTATVSLQNTANSTTAFQVQNASGTTLINADTTNMRMSVGSGGTAVGQLYVAGAMPSAQVGSMTLSGAQDTVVNGRYLYAAGFGSSVLDIFDVSNPASPVQIGSSLSLAGPPQGIAFAGHYVYAAEWSAHKLQIIDVSNPNAPSIVGSVTTTGSGGADKANAVAVSGRYAYVADGTSGVDVIDVSNPANPVKVTNIAISGVQSLSVFAAGRYVYVGTSNNSTNGFMKVIDTTSNSVVGSFTLSGGANGSVASSSVATYGPRSVYVQGRYAYVANANNSAIDVFDVSNPANLSGTPTKTVSTGTAPTGVGPLALVAQGRYLYVALSANGAAPSTFATYDISNISTMSQVGSSLSTHNVGVGLTVSGRYAYLSNYGSGDIQVFDMGGTYTQQLEAGGVETSTLQVDSDANFANNASISGGLQVAQSAYIQGNAAILGTLLVGSNLTLSNGVLDSGVADGSSAIGFTFNTNVTYATSGDLLFSIENNGTREFSIGPTGHIITGGSTPTATPLYPSGGIGSTGTCAVTGTDSAGTVTIVPGGSGITNGNLCTIAFAKSYTSTPAVLVGAGGGSSTQGYNAENDGPCDDVVSTAGFDVCTTSAPTSGQTISFTYIVEQ